MRKIILLIPVLFILMQLTAQDQFIGISPQKIDCKFCEEFDEVDIYESLRIVFKNGNYLNYKSSYNGTFDKVKQVLVYARSPSNGGGIPLFTLKKSKKKFTVEQFEGRVLLENQRGTPDYEIKINKIKENQLAKLVVDVANMVIDPLGKVISPNGLKFFNDLKNQIGSGNKEINLSLTGEFYDWDKKMITPTDAHIYYLPPRKFMDGQPKNFEKIYLNSGDTQSPTAYYKSLDGVEKEIPYPYFVLVRGKVDYISNLGDFDMPSSLMLNLDNLKPEKVDDIESQLISLKPKLTKKQYNGELFIVRFIKYYLDFRESTDHYNTFFAQFRESPFDDNSSLKELIQARKSIIKKLKLKSEYLGDLIAMYDASIVEKWSFKTHKDMARHIRKCEKKTEVVNSIFFQSMVELKHGRDLVFLTDVIEKGSLNRLRGHLSNTSVTQEQINTISNEFSALHNKYAIHSNIWQNSLDDFYDKLNEKKSDTQNRHILVEQSTDLLKSARDLEDASISLASNINSLEKSKPSVQKPDPHRAMIFDEFISSISKHKTSVDSKLTELNELISIIDSHLNGVNSLTNAVMNNIKTDLETSIASKKHLLESINEDFLADSFIDRLELDKSPKDYTPLSEVTVGYCRPRLKGRHVKSLIPINDWWRLGANESTFLSLTKKVLIDKETTIPNGEFALRVKREVNVRGGEEWKLMIHRDYVSWGNETLDENNVIAIIDLTPSILAKPVEQLTIDVVQDPGNQNAQKLMIYWGDLKLETGEIVFSEGE